MILASAAHGVLGNINLLPPLRVQQVEFAFKICGASKTLSVMAYIAKFNFKNAFQKNLQESYYNELKTYHMTDKNVVYKTDVCKTGIIKPVTYRAI